MVINNIPQARNLFRLDSSACDTQPSGHVVFLGQLNRSPAFLLEWRVILTPDTCFVSNPLLNVSRWGKGFSNPWKQRVCLALGLVMVGFPIIWTTWAAHVFSYGNGVWGLEGMIMLPGLCTCTWQCFHCQLPGQCL